MVPFNHDRCIALRKSCAVPCCFHKTYLYSTRPPRSRNAPSMDSTGFSSSQVSQAASLTCKRVTVERPSFTLLNNCEVVPSRVESRYRIYSCSQDNSAVFLRCLVKNKNSRRFISVLSREAATECSHG